MGEVMITIKPKSKAKRRAMAMENYTHYLSPYSTLIKISCGLKNQSVHGGLYLA